MGIANPARPGQQRRIPGLLPPEASFFAGQFEAPPVNRILGELVLSSANGTDRTGGNMGSAYTSPCVGSCSLSYPVQFVGLVTSPCHALVDTGAEDGVVGLWHWQRWMVCLALCHGRQPVFIPLPETCEAGGIGGSARPIGLCFVPTGIAGVNGITRWCILNEEEDQKMPPLSRSSYSSHWMRLSSQRGSA